MYTIPNSNNNNQEGGATIYIQLRSLELDVERLYVRGAPRV